VTAVLVTRPSGAADALVAALESRGYEVRAVPTVVTRRLPVDWPDLGAYQWAVVTSVAGVEALPESLAGPRWAAVGEATARALRARGTEAEIVPAESSGAALARAIPDPRGERMLVVRASLADPDLPADLRRRGAEVDEVTAYETVEGPAASRAPLHAALSAPGLGAVVFASGSAVRGFVKLGGANDIPAVTIGPRTTAVAHQQGFLVVAEAAGQSVERLVRAVEQAVPIQDRSDA
jgi:uroporphyrinogen-III synthase